METVQLEDVQESVQIAIDFGIDDWDSNAPADASCMGAYLSTLSDKELEKYYVQKRTDAAMMGFPY